MSEVLGTVVGETLSSLIFMDTSMIFRAIAYSRLHAEAHLRMSPVTPSAITTLYLILWSFMSLKKDAEQVATMIRIL